MLHSECYKMPTHSLVSIQIIDIFNFICAANILWKNKGVKKVWVTLACWIGPHIHCFTILGGRTIYAEWSFNSGRTTNPYLVTGNSYGFISYYALINTTFLSLFYGIWSTFLQLPDNRHKTCGLFVSVSFHMGQTFFLNAHKMFAKCTATPDTNRRIFFFSILPEIYS